VRILKKNIYWTILILLLPLAFFAAVFFCFKGAGNQPIENGIDRAAAAGRIRELTGDDYQGRQFGTPGGEKASEYIKSVLKEQGIESFHEEGYGMGFDATTAVYKSAEFNILDTGDGISGAFEIFKDYNPATKGFGGGIDYSGDVLLADGRIEDIPGYMLVGRLVAAKGDSLSEKAVKHVQKSGGEGILFYEYDDDTARFEIERKSVDASGKRSETIFIARISGSVYEKLQQRAGNGFIETAGGVKINVKIEFPYLKGENIIAYIPAEESDECLIFAAGYDGYGQYGEKGHVPGTIDNASGVAGLLELSGKLASMNSFPEMNIVFLFFDGEKSGASGIKNYIENPLFPIDKTEFVLLEKTGWKNSEKTWISYVDGDPYSERFAEIISKNYENAGLKALEGESGAGAKQKSLSEKGIPAVAISSVDGAAFETIEGSPRDNGGQWGAWSFERDIKGCIDFASNHAFQMLYPGHIDAGVLIFASLLAALLYILYVAGVLYARHPGASIGKRTIRKIYFSLPRVLLGRFAALIISLSAAIGVIALASNIGFMDTVSPNAAFVEMYSFIRNSIWGGNENLIGGGLILSAMFATLSMALTLVGGISFGAWRGAFGVKKSDERGILSLAAMSIPSFFWALGLLYVSLSCFGGSLYAGGSFEYSIKTIVFPLVSTALIPFVFLSLLVEGFVREEMDKEYVLSARARGFGTFEIVSRCMIKGVLAEAVKYIPEITVMTLSNLIVVEYIFGLPGLMNRLVSDMKNPQTVLGVMLLTGAFCMAALLLSRALRTLLSPKGGCRYEK